jgi:hypothetical protein
MQVPIIFTLLASVLWSHSPENKGLKPVGFGGTGSATLVRAINLRKHVEGTTGIERAVACPEAFSIVCTISTSKSEI